MNAKVRSGTASFHLSRLCCGRDAPLYLSAGWFWEAVSGACGAVSMGVAFFFLFLATVYSPKICPRPGLAEEKTL